MQMRISASALWLPLIAQGLCMAVDEFYFHWRRTLPRWERLGHPLDSLTVLACLAWLLAVPPNARALNVYAVLCIGSCLCITKDETVHQRYCRAGEHWLHAVLFILHPLVLLSAALLWPAWHGQTLSFISYTGYECNLLLSTTVVTLMFGLYQLVYWNFIWPRKRGLQARSTMTSTTN